MAVVWEGWGAAASAAVEGVLGSQRAGVAAACRKLVTARWPSGSLVGVVQTMRVEGEAMAEGRRSRAEGARGLSQGRVAAHQSPVLGPHHVCASCHVRYPLTDCAGRLLELDVKVLASREAR